MGAIGKKFTQLVRIPFWVAWPLMWLGAWFTIVFPLFGLDWFGYGIGVAFAVGFGAWLRPRYRVSVLERSERGVVLWVRRVKKADKERSEGSPPSSIVLPRQ
jgi:hypothetical protein